MLEAAPGDTITPILTGAPQDLVGTLTVALRSLPAETVTVAATTAGITETTFDDDTSNYVASVVIPSGAAAGPYEVVWTNDDVEVTESLQVHAYGSGDVTSFATAAHLQARMGRATAYADEQLAQVEILLELATGEILGAVSKTPAWAAEQDEIPSVLRSLCIELVVRVLMNPGGVRSESESLGAHQHAVTFADGMGAIVLTDEEVLRARRAVYGSNTASVRSDTFADTILDEGLVGDQYGTTSEDDDEEDEAA